jgi:hypothetical protein
MGEDEIAPELARLRSFGLHRPTLSDLQYMGVHKTHTAGWFAHFIHFTGNALLLLLITSLTAFICYRWYQRRQRRPKNRTADGAADRELVSGSSLVQTLLAPTSAVISIPRPVCAAHYNVRDESVQFDEMPYHNINIEVEREAIRVEREALIKRLSQIDATFFPVPSSPRSAEN